RQSHRVALALQRLLSTQGKHSAEVLDLAEYQFPVLEEVLHKHPNPPEGLLDFAQRIRHADAHIFVSPEYNGSYTAALKNAVDYLKEQEFARKVVGVASVSTGTLGGIRAALSMQQLVLGIGGYPIPQMLTVGRVAERFDEAGKLLDSAYEKNLLNFLNHFLWLAESVHARKQMLAQAAG
ncbi:MAG TPA: NADPH-dependent FMN reductase, partial [Saprospiraceae bacterium]|nr:NADPH-dependent FMN reductase [Saprospiraceae bacterium]